MTREHQIRERIAKVNEKIKSCGNELRRLLAELDEQHPVPRQSSVQEKAEQIRQSKIKIKAY